VQTQTQARLDLKNKQYVELHRAERKKNNRLLVVCVRWPSVLLLCVAVITCSVFICGNVVVISAAPYIGWMWFFAQDFSITRWVPLAVDHTAFIANRVLTEQQADFPSHVWIIAWIENTFPNLPYDWTPCSQLICNTHYSAGLARNCHDKFPS